MIKNNEVKIKKYKFDDERSIINNANNLGEVIKIVGKHPEIEWGDVLNDIKYYTKVVDRTNLRGREVITYETKGYSDQKLAYNDKKNKGDILLFTSPTCSRSSASITISGLSIETIKKDLKSVLPDGTNYVFAKYRGFGVAAINSLLKYIELYEEQVERQAKLTDNRRINLFKLDYMEKKKIVLTYYKDIVDSLLEIGSDGLIWGDLTDNQRKIYLDTLVSDSFKSRNIKNNLADDIANYTTLDELESFKNGNDRVLSRFVR